MSPVKWEGTKGLLRRRAREVGRDTFIGRPISMLREVGQSFYLIGLMAAMLTFYLGLGFLAVHLLG